jgi:sigma-B regulation protein RsbU (phosphoserine phosphatase)
MFNGQFVTLAILVIDPGSGRVLVANAGHPPPVVARGAGRVELLDVEPQLVAGVQADWEYPTQAFDLDGATSVLLYTDGVPDAPAATGDDRFDTEGILRCLAEARVESAAAMIDCVVVGVDRFRGTRDLSDDVTIVAVRIIRDGDPPRSSGVASREAAAVV